MKRKFVKKVKPVMHKKVHIQPTVLTIIKNAFIKYSIYKKLLSYFTVGL